MSDCLFGCLHFYANKILSLGIGHNARYDLRDTIYTNQRTEFLLII